MTTTELLPLILLGGGAFLLIGAAVHFTGVGSLNNIKSKTVGDGQHGTARWATKQEIQKTYRHIPFRPDLWRRGEDLPTAQGLVLGCVGGRGLKKPGKLAEKVRSLWRGKGAPRRKRPKQKPTAKPLWAIVDVDDIHCLMIGASGVGKTAFFLYPNLEYACASGMSFLALDTKGDLARNYPAILPEEQYRGAQERRRDRAVPVRKTPAQMELRRLCGGPPPAWVEQQTLTLLNRLVQHPERIASGQTEMEDPAESRKLRRELEEALQSPPVDGERTRNMALRLAEHRLNAIGAEEYETTRLQKLFRNHPLMEELERELLCESVRQITYRGKGIQVRLKNGQIMKGGQQP